MAPQPQGSALIGDISDEALDAAIDTAFDAEDGTDTEGTELTVAPEPDQSAPAGDSEPAGTEAPDTAPAGDATPATDAAAHPAPEAASAPAATAAGKPFQFNASGGVHTLTGASELPDGSVVISKDATTEFRRELAHGRELQANFTKYRRENDRKLRDVQSQRTAKDAEADAVIAWGSELASLSPQELAERLLDFQGNIPRYQLDLREKKLKEQERLVEEQRRGPQLSDEERQEQLVEQVGSMLDQEWQEILTAPAVAALPEADKRRVFDRWRQRPQMLMRRVADPKEAQALGVEPGSVVFDATELRNDLLYALELRKGAAPAAPSKAAQANAQRNADQTRGNRIPPTPRGAAPVGQPRKSNGQFKAAVGANRKQFKDYLMSNEDEEE